MCAYVRVQTHTQLQQNIKDSYNQHTSLALTTPSLSSCSEHNAYSCPHTGLNLVLISGSLQEDAYRDKKRDNKERQQLEDLILSSHFRLNFQGESVTKET